MKLLLGMMTQDVAWLASQLGNVKATTRVTDPSFSHGDFIWSLHAAELVYDSLVDMISPPTGPTVPVGWHAFSNATETCCSK